MMKIAFQWALALSLVLGSLDARAADARKATPFSKGPYIQAPAPNTVAILWESPSNYTATVRFGRDRKLDQSIGPVVPRQLTGVSGTLASDKDGSVASTITTTRRTNVFYLYEAVLENLNPAATYSYSVELDGRASPVRRFKALDPEAKRVRFIAYGDTRSLPAIHERLARRFSANAPDFILHTGDLVARGEDYALWAKEFFSPLAGVIDHIPMFSVIGNHEHDCTNYLRYFRLPGAERWYSVDLGPVHVLALDFHFEDATDEQFQFARRDLLASKAPWKIVFMHEPVFNIGGHASAWGHKNYLPLFHEAHVDLVLAGHSHMYERFRPLAAWNTPGEWPITHITTGGGGANLHTSLAHPALLAHATTNHYMVFDVTRDTLRGRAILAGGQELDHFTFRKPDGQLAPKYLAQVLPEELVNLSVVIGPQLAGRAAAVPGPTNSANVTFSLAPLKKSPGPATLEIGLTPESARYYVLDPGPATAFMATAGGTNVVSVRVRSTGKQKVTEDKSHYLSPALVFQAKVKTEAGQTVAYGTKTRVVKSP